MAYYKLTVANYIDRQTSNATYSSSVAHKHSITLPDRSMPPMEADAAYQGCLPASYTVDQSLSGVQAHAILRLRTRGLRNLEIAHTCYAISRLRTRVTQSRDCLCNLEIANFQITRHDEVILFLDLVLWAIGVGNLTRPVAILSAGFPFCF